MLAQLAYISSTARPLSEEDIAQILASSRRNNAEVDVTGALLHGGDTFMQILEGPREGVASVFSRIQMDRRHRSVTVLLHDPVGRRQLPEDPMTFYAISNLPGEDRQRARSLFDPSVDQRSRARLLVRTFNELDRSGFAPGRAA